MLSTRPLKHACSDLTAHVTLAAHTHTTACHETLHNPYIHTPVPQHPSHNGTAFTTARLSFRLVSVHPSHSRAPTATPRPAAPTSPFPSRTNPLRHHGLRRHCGLLLLRRRLLRRQLPQRGRRLRQAAAQRARQLRLRAAQQLGQRGANQRQVPGRRRGARGGAAAWAAQHRIAAWYVAWDRWHQASGAQCDARIAAVQRHLSSVATRGCPAANRCLSKHAAPTPYVALGFPQHALHRPLTRSPHLYP